MTQAEKRTERRRRILFCGIGAIAVAVLLGFAITAGLLFLGLLVDLNSADNSRPTETPHEGRSTSWRAFDRSQWGFQVDLPGEPVIQQRTTPKGRPLNVFLIRTDDCLFTVFASLSSSDSSDPQQFINEVQARAYTEGERFLHEQFVDVPKADAGKELHFIDRYDELTMLRFVVKDDDFYQVVWSGKSADRNSQSARRFLDSFRIVAIQEQIQ